MEGHLPHSTSSPACDIESRGFQFVKRFCKREPADPSCPTSLNFPLNMEPILLLFSGLSSDSLREPWAPTSKIDASLCCASLSKSPDDASGCTRLAAAPPLPFFVKGAIQEARRAGEARPLGSRPSDCWSPSELKSFQASCFCWPPHPIHEWSLSKSTRHACVRRRLRDAPFRTEVDSSCSTSGWEPEPSSIVVAVAGADLG
mmetsp:Transcript_104131/g.269635  ORF Transcript_104131/g.269635 Transcript_104131/m.269635 type:complete len:202 (-) Transcript_104131:150-755(-)